MEWAEGTVSRSQQKEDQYQETFPGTFPVVEGMRISLPMWGHRFNLWLEKIPHVLEQLSPCATATEGQTPRAQGPQQETPLQWGACVLHGRPAPTHHHSKKPAKNKNKLLFLKKGRNFPWPLPGSHWSPDILLFLPLDRMLESQRKVLKTLMPEFHPQPMWLHWSKVCLGWDYSSFT